MPKIKRAHDEDYAGVSLAYSDSGTDRIVSRWTASRELVMIANLVSCKSTTNMMTILQDSGLKPVFSSHTRPDFPAYSGGIILSNLQYDLQEREYCSIVQL